MSVEENKEILLRAVQARNNGDLAGFLSIFPEEMQKGATAGFNFFTKTFPGLQLVIENVLGEGDKVAYKWTMCATHAGEYRGIPATQKQITWVGIDIWTFENGKVKSIDRISDDLGLFKQMGATLSWHEEVIT